MLEIPDLFIEMAAHRNGEDGRKWAATLPDLIYSLCKEWHLNIDGPPMHGYLGLVIPVLRENQPYVLKISWINEDTINEAAALALWNGSGYPAPDHHLTRIVCEHCGYSETKGEHSWKGPVYGRIKQKCPNCRYQIEKRQTTPRYLPETQLKCPQCETLITVVIKWHSDYLITAHDPFFSLPLWFVDSFKGHELWAYNQEQLTFMKQYVSADFRQKAPNQNRTLPNRLPKWMLDRKNRSDILKAFERLENKLPNKR